MLIWTLFIGLSFLLMGCSNKSEKQEPAVTELTEEQKDSIGREEWHKARIEYYKERTTKFHKDLKLENLERCKDEAYRVIIDFGWGNRWGGGSPLSIKLKKNNDVNYAVIKEAIRYYNEDIPGRKLKTTTKFIDDSSFYYIHSYFASIDFWNLSTNVKPRVISSDASYYILEGVRDGNYNIIEREDSVEEFVYDLFNKFIVISDYNEEMIDRINYCTDSLRAVAEH